MKAKKMAFALLMLLCIPAVSGCVQGGEARNEDNGRLQIVTTVFPPYDFVRQIAGNRADMTILLSPGMESHSYEPTPQDMLAIQECDLFLYGGGESDTWVQTVLDSLDSGTIRTLRMMECVPVIEEEALQGMQEYEADFAKHGHEGEMEYDEHVWTSPVNAARIVAAIREELMVLDPANADVYLANGLDYEKKLEELDREFREWREGLKNPVLVFGDRFPFLYLAKEYDLECYAAFPGCSSETEPSARTVAVLIDKIEQDGLKAVFYPELTNARVAEAISESTGVPALQLHSCHNVSGDEREAGVTYLSLMKQNLEILKGAVE